jgi:hypothetical protein
MFSAAVRTPPEHMWRSNMKHSHIADYLRSVRLCRMWHSSSFSLRYRCGNVDIKCPKIVKSTLIFNTISPVYMGFIAYRTQYYLILSIALLYIYPLIAHSISQLLSLRRLKTAQHATTNNQPYQSTINVGIV